jgi:ribosomal protein S18 acetylase RimI-like enzyme
MHKIAAYYKEREGIDSLVYEGGFATYIISGEECYIKDIYVEADYRNNHIASKMADEITKIAKKSGCKYLTGTVVPLANNSTESVEVLLAYGFKLSGAVQNGVFFRKEI